MNHFPYTKLEKEIRENRKWLTFSGVILVCCGLTLLLSFYFHPYIVNIIAGCSLVVASMIFLIHSYLFWYGKIFGLVLHVISAVLYFIIGLVFILNNWLTIYPYYYLLVLVLILSYLIMGMFRIFLSLMQNLKNGWLWTFYAGVINLILISFLTFSLVKFPFSAIIVATGIDVLATGIALFALGVNPQYKKSNQKQ